MNTNEKVEPRKIGGWLILIAIGVFLCPFKVTHSLLTEYLPLFSSETWEVITSQSSDWYKSFMTILIFELIVKVSILIASPYLIFLFLKKKRTFPKWYIGIAIVVVTSSLMSTLMANYFWPETAIFDQENIEGIGGPLLSLFIWCPYLFYSKRSKQTFII
ncbi:MAG: DUF2569 domain-containing protein [Desulfotalea sp.]